MPIQKIPPIPISPPPRYLQFWKQWRLGLRCTSNYWTQIEWTELSSMVLSSYDVCGRGEDDTSPELLNHERRIRSQRMDENNMVMSWLLTQWLAMLWNAQEIREAARETYSDSEDTAEAFKIKGILHDFRQGDLSITQYFSSLNSILPTIVHIRDHQMGLSNRCNQVKEDCWEETNP